jgi:hypothetical protein
VHAALWAALLCRQEKADGIADFVSLAATLQGAGIAWKWNQRGVMREHCCG